MSIDWSRTMEAIEARATAGLQRAAEHALERARYHAPVRAIFDRSRRGPAFNKGFKTIRSAGRYEAFLRSKARSRAVNVNRIDRAQRARTASLKVDDVTTSFSGRRDRGSQGGVSSRGENIAATEASRLASPGARLSGKRGGRRSFSGHNNSLMPVFRQGNSRITGDFRQHGDTVGDVVRQRSGQRARGVREESLERFGKRGSGNPAEALKAQRLTSRGRYEYKNAKSRGLFQGRVGGRLRGELRLSAPTKRGNTIWIYVESPTPYAVHQEFGTQRHRAQPFLRPALYESRNVLRFEVRKAIDNRFNSLPEV